MSDESSSCVSLSTADTARTDASSVITTTLTTEAGTTSTNSAIQRSSGPRKNSAERNIIHTRMEDEDVQKEYIYGESLGEGSFGKVYRAKHAQTGETVAIKEIVKERAGSSGLRQLEKEVSIFKKVDHRNIIKLKEVIESSKQMYLIMELCEGGDLAKLLQKRSHLTESDTKTVMSGLASAIKYLHQQGIIHRDLKLENILLAEEPGKNGNLWIKVSDFGLSTQQNNNSYENMQEQYCGTLSYMAPEMNSTYSYPVDVWAMGIIMYYLLTRYPKDNELNESIAKDGPLFQEHHWKNVSDQAKDLLREMLKINPAYRLSSGEVLNHEWFTGKKREHGNVLELMRDFGREQKENENSMVACDRQEESAISGSEKHKQGETVLGVSPELSSAAKKQSDLVKASNEKKVVSSERASRAASSSGSANAKASKLKAAGTHTHTPSPRQATRTPPSKSGPEGSGKSSTMATKTTCSSPKLQAPTAANGPANRFPPGSTPKIAPNTKIRRK